MHLQTQTTAKPSGKTSAALTLAALLSLSAFALGPARAQDAAPPDAPQPGPATAPPPAPGTDVPSPEQAPAATPDEAPNYKIQYTGLVDGYLQYSFQNPAGTLLETSTASGTLIGGAYNARIKQPTLALAELNVFRNAPPSGFGFKATLIAGDTADQNHLNFNYQDGTTGPAGGTEAEFKNIQQLYGTYAFSGKGGGIDIGKFYTPFGYEVTEANADYNYTRSLPYGLLPFYHAGIRVYSPSFNGLTVTGYVTNAIYNTTTAGVHDDNGKKGYIGQVNYTAPNGKYVAIGTLGGGKDRFGGTDTQSTVFDGDFTYNITPTMLAGANYNYINLKPDGGGTKTTSNGYAVYFRQALTPKTAYALRFSGFKTDLRTPGTPNPKPTEFTATYELKPAANFTTRLEYRHNSSNLDGTFLGHNEAAVTGGTKKNEDLIVLAGMFTF